MKIIEDGNFTNAFSASVTIISVILMLIALLFVKDVHDWKGSFLNCAHLFWQT